MNELWFSVAYVDRIVIRVHTRCLLKKKPAILQKLLGLLRSGEKNAMRILTQEFPKDSKTIEALDNLLGHYRIANVNGIHWNSERGHSIHIVTM